MGPQRTIGETIRFAREARGLDLEDVSRDTRLTLSVLRRIEQDRFAELPGGIYTQNYLRILAEHLALDSVALLAAYRDQMGSSVEGPPPDGVWREESVVETRVQAWRPGWRFWGILAIALVAAYLLAWWQGWLPGPGVAPPISDEPISAPQATAPPTAEALDAAPDRDRATGGEEAAAPQAAALQAAATPAAFERPPVFLDPTAAAARRDAGPPAPCTPRLRVELSAAGPCRVQVNMDGRRHLAHRFAGAGERWVLLAEDFVVLSVAQGQNLRLRVNGEERPLPAGGRQVALRLDAPPGA
ncbi:MAG: helix-turn-helix domain-containing protein [Candidatus Krumholzibacteriota bacterium]|nr:helix-turn-helix domain-containing protein [Candidatus Krumholzibacteriota bacterium]